MRYANSRHAFICIITRERNETRVPVESWLGNARFYSWKDCVMKKKKKKMRRENETKKRDIVSQKILEQEKKQRKLTKRLFSFLLKHFKNEKSYRSLSKKKKQTNKNCIFL